MKYRTNWDIISCDNVLFKAAYNELCQIYILNGEDPDDIKFKDIAEYVNNKPYPFKPNPYKRINKE